MSKVVKNIVSESTPLPPVEPAIFIDVKPDSLVESIEKLSRMYEFRDKDAVVEYLQEYPFLLDVLFEAREQIDLYFSTDTPTVLTVFTDVDSGGSRELFVLALTRCPVAEALERLERLDQGWWLDASERVDCRMNIHVEYV